MTKLWPLFVLLNIPAILFSADERDKMKWNAYTNTKYGFSIEYPGFARAKESEGGEVDFEVWFRGEYGDADCNFTVEVLFNERKLSPIEFWKEWLGSPSPPEEASLMKTTCPKKDVPIKINNAKGFYSYCLDEIPISEDKFQKSETESYSFFISSYVIHFVVIWPDIKTYPKKDREILKQTAKIHKRMLRSFRLLEPETKKSGP